MRTPPMLAFALAFVGSPAAAFELNLPIDCELGTTCFLQQGPDTDPTSAAVDSRCGGATYDGHDGTDFRIRSLVDLDSHVPVVAAADGIVSGVRDGVPDHLVTSQADRDAIAGIECGNGILITHPDGWKTQYCHLQKGSISVSEGDTIATGALLGFVGASGLVQFPHVHLSVQHDGVDIDPFTGRMLTDGVCGSEEETHPLWSTALPASLFDWDGGLLDMGFAGDPLDYDSLVTKGAPAEPTTSSTGLIAWAWFYNLQQGDVVQIALETADGTPIAVKELPPLVSNKAVYAAFSGKRGAPDAGTYRMHATVVREGVPVIEDMREVTLE